MNNSTKKNHVSMRNYIVLVLFICLVFWSILVFTVFKISVTNYLKNMGEQVLVEKMSKEIFLLISEFLLVIMAVVLIIAYFLSKIFVSPLELLTRAAARVTQGDVNIKISEDISYIKEIIGFAEAFNSMTENLQKITVSRDQLSKEIEVRKKAEKQLDEEHGFIKTAINALNYPFYVIDRNYTVVLANAAAIKNGVTVGGYCYEFTHKRETPCSGGNDICPLEQVIRTKRSVKVEHTHFDAKGRAKIVEVYGDPIVDDNGEVIKMIEYSIDITERVRFAWELKQQRDFIQKAVDSLNFPFVVIDTERVIQLANIAAKRNGADVGTYCYNSRQGLSVPCSINGISCPFDEVMKTKKAAVAENTFKLKGGTVVVLQMHADPILDNEGNIFQVVTYEIDVTYRKQAEAELKVAYEQLKSAQHQLIQAAKMQVVGGLASGVAHEVKNPLAIIMQGLEFIKKKIDMNDKNSQLSISYMYDAVKRADAIIRGLLDFSSISELSLSSEDLNQVVQDSLLLVKHQLDKYHIKAVKDFSEGLPDVKMDKNRIEQVLVNLFLNAVYAMPEGGKLFIRTYLDKNPKKDNAGAVIEIEDTGSGIPADLVDKIFDPFFTTRRTKGGTGLGLSVVRTLVNMHGGSISIKNKPGPETGVIVRLCF